MRHALRTCGGIAEVTEALSSPPGETGLGNPKASKTPPVPEEERERSGKGLANLWSRKKITKRAYACRGQETQWEISIARGLSIRQQDFY